MVTAEADEFATPVSWRAESEGAIRPSGLPVSILELERRGFRVLESGEHGVRAVRRRFRGDLLTTVHVAVWLQKVPSLDGPQIMADAEALRVWAGRLDRGRLTTKIHLLLYLTESTTPEARALAVQGPYIGWNRIDGLGIRDAEAVHAYRSVRLWGLAFFPIVNFLVTTLLSPQSRSEPRVWWVWVIIVVVGTLPLVGTLGWIGLTLLRARGAI